MARGTYTLLLELDRSATLSVGALGERRFDAGAYAYTGSALGPGGFARVDRHRRLATADDGTRHWHIDHLLPPATLTADFTAPDVAAECALAQAIPGDRVVGFGASDCGCEAHLVYSPAPSALREHLSELYADPAAYAPD